MSSVAPPARSDNNINKKNNNNNNNKNRKRKTARPRRLFFSEREVLEGRDFFVGGRGGYGVNHKGNSSARQVLQSFAPDYRRANSSQKTQILDHLVHDVFPHLTFVMKRDQLVEQLATLTTRTKQNRNRCVLRLHGSVARIAAYPAVGGEYVALGEEYAREILKKKLQELARLERRRAFQQTAKTFTHCGLVEENETETSSSVRGGDGEPDSSTGAVAAALEAASHSCNDDDDDDDDSVTTPVDLDCSPALEQETQEDATTMCVRRVTPQNGASRPVRKLDHCRGVFPASVATSAAVCLDEILVPRFVFPIVAATPQEPSSEINNNNVVQGLLEQTRADRVVYHHTIPQKCPHQNNVRTKQIAVSSNTVLGASWDNCRDAVVERKSYSTLRTTTTTMTGQLQLGLENGQQHANTAVGSGYGGRRLPSSCYSTTGAMAFPPPINLDQGSALTPQFDCEETLLLLDCLLASGQEG